MQLLNAARSGRMAVAAGGGLAFLVLILPLRLVVEQQECGITPDPNLQFGP
jgi:hypothetical protein